MIEDRGPDGTFTFFLGRTLLRIKNNLRRSTQETKRDTR
jgi:hypothetical protein